jgi:hypothetical protein
MNPYTTNAIAAQRRSDMHAEAAVERLARQAGARRAVCSPRLPGSRPVAPVGGHRARRQGLLGRWVSGRALPI